MNFCWDSDGIILRFCKHSVEILLGFCWDSVEILPGFCWRFCGDAAINLWEISTKNSSKIIKKMSKLVPGASLGALGDPSGNKPVFGDLFLRDFIGFWRLLGIPWGPYFHTFLELILEQFSGSLQWPLLPTFDSILTPFWLPIWCTLRSRRPNENWALV